MQNEIRNAQTAGNGQPVHDEELSWRRTITLLAVLGIAGHAFSAAIAWLLPLFSGYTLIGNNISELVLGRYGYLQTAFLAAGVGTLAIAVGVRWATNGSWGSRVGSLLVGFFGAGSILLAIFPTDRTDTPEDLSSMTTVGTIHILVSLVSFACAIAGMLVLTRTFKQDARW